MKKPKRAPDTEYIHNEIHGCKEIAARSAGGESKICGRNIAGIPVNRRQSRGVCEFYILPGTQEASRGAR